MKIESSRHVKCIGLFSLFQYLKEIESGKEKYYGERQHYGEGGTHHGLYPDGNIALVADYCIDRLVRLWIMETLMESAYVERHRLTIADGAHRVRREWQHVVQVKYCAAASDFRCCVFHEA